MVFPKVNDESGLLAFPSLEKHATDPRKGEGALVAEATKPPHSLPVRGGREPP